MESECARLSQLSLPLSPFRRIPTDEYATFEWKIIENLSQEVSTLFYVLSSISDHRNKKKVNTAHYPCLCMTVVVLLKERDVWSAISHLSYSILDKQVTQHTYT